MAISRMRFKASNNGTYYIDLAKALSLQERRLHRQKAIYTVYGGYFVDAQGNRVELNTAPMTWVTKRAVNRGFAMWRKMTAKALEDAGASSKAPYRDYKVFLDNQMGTAPLVPLDASDNNLYGFAPEWDYSTLTSSDPFEDPGTGLKVGPDQYDLMIVGKHVGSNPDFTRVGLVESWFQSRPRPQVSQPNDIPDVNDPLVNMFDTGDVIDDRLTIINTEGDAAPYNEQDGFGNVMTGGASNNLQRQSVAVPATATPVAAVHGFQALCGLIQVVVGEGSTTANAWELVLDVETKGEQF